MQLWRMPLWFLENVLDLEFNHMLSFKPHRNFFFFFNHVQCASLCFQTTKEKRPLISKPVSSSSVEFLIRPNNIHKVMFNIVAWSLTGNTCCLNAKCSICQLVCYTLLLHRYHHDPDAFWQPLPERTGYSCMRCAGHSALLLLRRKQHCSDLTYYTDWIIWNFLKKTMELN